MIPPQPSPSAARNDKETENLSNSDVNMDPSRHLPAQS